MIGAGFDCTMTPWFWAAAAAALAGIEVMAPGVFMIWLAAAAAATALLTWAFAPGWELQMVIFAVLAGISVIAARQLVLRPRPVTGPGLNRPADRLVGTLVTVVEPISAGQGRVQVGDSPWPASGPDLPAGARARVLAVNGTTLEVGPA